MDLFRDTVTGQIIRLITRNRLLQYPDERDPDAFVNTVNPATTQMSAISRWSTTRNPNLHYRDEPRTPRLPAIPQDPAPAPSPIPTPAPAPVADQVAISRSSVDGNDGALEKDLERALTASTESSGSTTDDSDSEEPMKLNKVRTAPDTKVITFLPGDAANPQNWSLTKKVFVSGLICFLTFSIYIGSAVYTAGIVSIEEQFHVSEVAAVVGLTLFVFGYGLGPMFLAPLAEAPPIGRSPVYIFSSLCFVLLNFGVVYASNLGMILAFRFLTGFFGSPVLATGGSSLADMWAPRKRGYAIGVWGLFAVCGPVLGPLVGGFAAEAKGWTWTIWELIWLNAFCFILLALTLPETSSANIELRRAKRLRKTLNDPTIQSTSEIEVQNMEMKEVFLGALWRPFQLMLTEPILLLTDMYLGLVYAVLYCWFEAFPIAFIGIYGFNGGTLGLSYLGILVGALIVMIPYFVYLYLVQEPKFNNGTMTPEDRLPPAIVGSVCIPICLFWFGWTARESIHWIVPIIGSSFFSIGATLLFNSLLNYQGDAFPEYVGSALAGNDFARSAMGGAFPIFAGAMFNNLGLGWGCSLLGFISVAFIPMILIFYKYGSKIRAMSKNAHG